jgi:hypothetical protein
MRFKKQCPSVEDLHHWFTCDYSTGTLYWKNPRGSKAKAGDKVYTYNKNYPVINIQIDNKRHEFRAHRIIWKMYYRQDLGQQELDHIDEDKYNNAISNLRIATPSQNQYNRSYALGFKRDSYKKRNGEPCSTGGWTVRLNIDGIQKHIGSFPCPLLARLAYQDAKRTAAMQFSPI